MDPEPDATLTQPMQHIRQPRFKLQLRQRDIPIRVTLRNGRQQLQLLRRKNILKSLLRRGHLHISGLFRRNRRFADFPQQQVIITDIHIPGIDHDPVTVENEAGKPCRKCPLKKRSQCRHRGLHHARSNTSSAVQRITSCRLSSHGLSDCGAFFPISFHIGSSP